MTESLRRAIRCYQRQVSLRIDRMKSPDYVCNNLGGEHGDSLGPARKRFCTSLTSEVAALAAEAPLPIGPEARSRSRR